MAKVVQFDAFDIRAMGPEGTAAKCNIGDRIREIVFEEIMNNIGVKDNDRIHLTWESIKSYEGEQVIWPYINALTSESVDSLFPCSEYIHPLFLCTVMIDDIFENRSDLVDFFKKHEPIGCRDEFTKNIFIRYGIEAYLVGCYTMAMDFKPVGNHSLSETNLIVDLTDEAYKFVPENIKENSRRITHNTTIESYPPTAEEQSRWWKLARDYISMYHDPSGIVVSSRIHGSVPAIVAGKKVVIMIDNADHRFEWLDKWVPIYQIGDYDKIDWNPKPVDTTWIKAKILDLYKRAINNENYNEILQELDVFYMDRNRIVTFQTIRDRLKRIPQMVSDNSEFNYAIWGAGAHCGYVMDIIKESYPKARVTCIVDKYKRGSKKGIPIIGSDSLNKYNYEIIIITTRAGRSEAEEFIHSQYGDLASDKYIVACSQQLS